MNSGKIIDLGLSVDQEYLKTSVQDIVNAGIIQALGDPSVLVRQAIEKTVNTMVDEDGKPTTNSYRAMRYLDWVAKKTVETTIREAMTQMIKDQADPLREELLKQLRSKKFQGSLASGFLESVTSKAFDHWKMPVTVSFEANKNS